VEPAVAAFAGLIFLHEVLTPPQWLAVALVIAASTGSTLTSLRADRNEASAEEGWQGG
jgi:inner membrane transporter RhtA